MGYDNGGRAGVDMGGRAQAARLASDYRESAGYGEAATEEAIEQKLRDHHRDQDRHKMNVASGEAIADLLRHAGFNIDQLQGERVFGRIHHEDRRTENARLSDTVEAINRKEFEPARPKRSGVLEDMIGFVNSEIEMLRGATNRLCVHSDRALGTPPKDDLEGAMRSTVAGDDGPAITRLWTALHELSDARRGVMNQVDRAASLIDL